MVACTCVSTVYTVGKTVRFQKPTKAQVVGAPSKQNRCLSFGAGVLAATIIASPAFAEESLIDKLLAQSEANKELNDKKRLATSYANLERSRTVTDGTCAFPNNLIGCENAAEMGKVKFMSDDIKLECEGKEEGKCPSRAKGSFPSFLGV